MEHQRLLAFLIVVVITLVFFLGLLSPTIDTDYLPVFVKHKLYGPTCEPYKAKSLDCKRPNLKEWKPQESYTNFQWLRFTSNCSNLKEKFCFPTKPLTQEEAEFPLAFVLIVHKNSEQIIRLLQSIYWPQNKYCITYDEKSTRRIKRMVQNLANCFPDNIVLPEKHETIYWGKIEVLKAAINCMKVLNKGTNGWRYIQILSWSDLPLKTNKEMVDILKVFNGSNDAEMKKGQQERFTHKVEFSPDEKGIPTHWAKRLILPGYGGKFYLNTKFKKSPPPRRMTVFKGSFSATTSREFVDFVVRNPTANDFLEWLNDTMVPDETYWSSLIHNPSIGTPGSFPGNRCLNAYGKGVSKPWISRYQVWPGTSKVCHGTWTHGSCVFGVDDLPTLKNRRELVAHKFYIDFEPAAYYCWLEYIQNRTYFHQKFKDIDIDYYKNLPAVRYQNSKSKSTFVCNTDNNL